MARFLTEKEIPYLTFDAKLALAEFVKRGIDRDLAVEMVVESLGEEKTWEL